MMETLVAILLGIVMGFAIGWLIWIITTIVDIVKTRRELKDLELRRKIREEIQNEKQL